MSLEQQVGHLTGLMESVREDVQDIRENMVTRAEFENTAIEHIEFKEKLEVLTANHERGHYFRIMLKRGLVVLAGALTLAALAFVGIG